MPTASALSVTLIVALGASVAKSVGLGKELLVAYQLGAGPQLDAFLYAYTFPAFLVAVVGGAFSASFIPCYLATERDQSASVARRFAGELATIIAATTVILVLLAIPLVSKLLPILAGGFDTATKSAAIGLLPILMPLLGVSVLSTMWASLLNAHRRFFAAAFVPAITPLVVVCALFGHVCSSDAMSLALGTVVGGTLEVCILAACTRSAGLDLFRWPRRWRKEYGLVLKQFVPAAGSIVLMSATMLIDQSFAANLTAGSVSAVSFGTKLASVGASILVVVVSTLALPAFSRMAAEGHFANLRRAYLTACAATLLVTVPIAATFSLGAEPIVSLLYQRGNFTGDDVALAASVQAAQAWHLVPYILSIVAVRALAAISETWLMVVGAAANLVADLLVNTLLVPKLGVVGIGLASTVMYSASAVVLSTGFLIRIRRRYAAG